MNTIGQNIAELRKKKGLTQEELAEKMCVTAQAVSKWERDASYPDVTALSALAKALGVSVAAIVEGGQSAPELKEAAPDAIARRVVCIKVHVGPDMDMKVQFPVTALKKMMDNGVLKQMIDDEDDEDDEEDYLLISSVLQSAVEMGCVGPIMNVDANGTQVRISVEDYEG